MDRAIKTYGDIVKRIAEIIIISENKKNELEQSELKENYNNHFAYILYYDIDISLASEFRELIDAERTFKIISNASPLNYLDKTRMLLSACKDKANPNNGDYVYYGEIVQIISESYGKSVYDLTEYKGYYILRGSFNKWLWLMRKLELFPDEKRMNDNERKEAVNQYLFQNHEQYNRLQNVFKKLNTKGEVIDSSKSTFKPNLNNKKHSDIILMGINGDLKLEYLQNLKFLYDKEEFENLLTELLEWQIFTQEELNSLHTMETKSEIILDGKDSLDKLIKFFSSNEDKITDANGLRYLKPIIGEENLKNLVDTLHTLGVISENVYAQYLNLDNINVKKL